MEKVYSKHNLGRDLYAEKFCEPSEVFFFFNHKEDARTMRNCGQNLLKLKMYYSHLKH